MKEELDRWYKRTWETKGVRFLASQRLKLHEKWSTITLALLSVYIIVLNLSRFLPNKTSLLSSENITFSTISLSMLVLVTSLFISSRNYKIRSLKLHDCGREIGEVYDKICILINQGGSASEQEFEETRNKYYSVLNKYENHESLDFQHFIANNLTDYEGRIKHPNWYSFRIKVWYYWDTVIRYWIFILIPVIIYAWLKIAVPNSIS